MSKVKNQIVFIYDRLMTQETQRILRLPIRFLSFGRVWASLYWSYDGRERRYFLVPPKHKSNRQQPIWVYGGVYVINDFTHFSKGFYSFYNCSIPYTGTTMQQDFYYPIRLLVEAIKFNTFTDLERDKVMSTAPIKALTMVGNLENNKIRRATVYNEVHYGMDICNMIQTIKEVNNEG